MSLRNRLIGLRLVHEWHLQLKPNQIQKDNAKEENTDKSESD